MKVIRPDYLPLTCSSLFGKNTTSTQILGLQCCLIPNGQQGNIDTETSQKWGFQKLRYHIVWLKFWSSMHPSDLWSKRGTTDKTRGCGMESSRTGWSDPKLLTGQRLGSHAPGLSFPGKVSPLCLLLLGMYTTNLCNVRSETRKGY